MSIVHLFMGIICTSKDIFKKKWTAIVTPQFGVTIAVLFLDFNVILQDTVGPRWSLFYESIVYL